jgi:enoyl-CoA hydratase/carnithine racemase
LPFNPEEKRVADEAVVLEIEDHIATVRINRPENRNSMTPEVLEGIGAALARVREDGAVRCVVVTGSGKSFCAGADFRSQPAESDLPAHERLYATYHHFLEIADLELPTIAAMNGHAIGGGLGLALVCDLRVASASARYGANFVQLGMHPGMAITYLMPRLTGVPKAVELLLTGRILSGEEAASAGLVHYAVEPEQVMARALELAREIAKAAPLAVRWTKQSIYRNLDWSPRRAAQLEAMVQSRTMETQDFREGVSALLKKRPPEFEGR